MFGRGGARCAILLLAIAGLASMSGSALLRHASAIGPVTDFAAGPFGPFPGPTQVGDFFECVSDPASFTLAYSVTVVRPNGSGGTEPAAGEPVTVTTTYEMLVNGKGMTDTVIADAAGVARFGIAFVNSSVAAGTAMIKATTADESHTITGKNPKMGTVVGIQAGYPKIVSPAPPGSIAPGTTATIAVQTQPAGLGGLITWEVKKSDGTPFTLDFTPHLPIPPAPDIGSTGSPPPDVLADIVFQECGTYLVINRCQKLGSKPSEPAVIAIPCKVDFFFITPDPGVILPTETKTFTAIGFTLKPGVTKAPPDEVDGHELDPSNPDDLALISKSGDKVGPVVVDWKLHGDNGRGHHAKVVLVGEGASADGETARGASVQVKALEGGHSLHRGLMATLPASATTISPPPTDEVDLIVPFIEKVEYEDVFFVSDPPGGLTNVELAADHLLPIDHPVNDRPFREWALKTGKDGPVAAGYDPSLALKDVTDEDVFKGEKGFAEVRNKVRVKATIGPTDEKTKRALRGTKVFFKSFDVADQYNDFANNQGGTWAIDLSPKKQAIPTIGFSTYTFSPEGKLEPVDADGGRELRELRGETALSATVVLEVSLSPGDNYRVVASLSLDRLKALVADTGASANLERNVLDPGNANKPVTDSQGHDFDGRAHARVRRPHGVARGPHRGRQHAACRHRGSEA